MAIGIAICTTTKSFVQLVTSGADDGTDGTLRQEIADTSAVGTITFMRTVWTVNPMDIGNMASGLYIVNINSERGSTSHRLILD